MYKSQHGRADRLIQEKNHDPYRGKVKWPENTVCRRCGVVFSEGRWQWPKEEMVPIEVVESAQDCLCPACQRIKDNYPAGTVQIAGTFFKRRKDEIMRLVSNEEELEKATRPLERIMSIDEQGDGGVVISTTGIHIARRIGEALKSAYQGELDMRYGEGEKFIRITWRRD